MAAQELFALPTGKNGLVFDGVLKKAIISTTAFAEIFDSPIYPDGKCIRTSRIVKTGKFQGIPYIETQGRSRYFVESICDEGFQNAHEWLEELQKRIDAGGEFYTRLQWS